MKSLQVLENTSFIGREFECQQLEKIAAYKEAAILIVYGRRRVGKTELIEQSYRQRNIIKIEGVEGKSEHEQRDLVLLQISVLSGNPLYAKLKCDSWIEVFNILAKHVQTGTWTLYFEEVQWLADYGDNFISELKYSWDNAFRHNPKLRLILCGSSPSFMINHVIHSKSLYNRSQFEIHLQPFNLRESKTLLKKRSNREIFNAYLSVGGIPEYLKRINQETSILIGLCSEAFRKNAYLVTEFEKIFISSLSDSTHYKEIIEFLSKVKFATRQKISEKIGIKPGGTLSVLLTDLKLCGFIEEYTSYHLPNSPSLVRYCIADHYLMFYFKFIKPKLREINQGRYNVEPVAALNLESFHKWLGFSFERFCRNNSFVIAKMLGFSGVEYTSGAYFSKRLDKSQPGYQVDLVFDRADNVLTVCEIRYLQRKVDQSIIEEFDRKLDYLPNRKSKTIHKVLIAANGVTDNLSERHYFDRVITLDEFFSLNLNVKT